MKITNDLVYVAASRMLEVWRSCKPNDFYDLADKTLWKDIDNVRFEPAYNDGRSTGLEMTYVHKGYRVLTVVIPQFRQDKTKIRTFGNRFDVKKFDIPFEEIPLEIAKLKNDLEGMVNGQEFIQTSLPETEFVTEAA